MAPYNSETGRAQRSMGASTNGCFRVVASIYTTTPSARIHTMPHNCSSCGWSRSPTRVTSCLMDGRCLASIYTTTPSYRTPAQLHDSLPRGSTRYRVTKLKFNRKKRRASFFRERQDRDSAEYILGNSWWIRAAAFQRLRTMWAGKNRVSKPSSNLQEIEDETIECGMSAPGAAVVIVPTNTRFITLFPCRTSQCRRQRRLLQSEFSSANNALFLP
jgi:hypothetical protein